MRLLFLILLTLNITIFWWGRVFGLPNYFAGENMEPLTSSRVDVGQRLALLVESKQERRHPVGAGALPQKCKMAGPFESDFTANTFIERLRALDVVASIIFVEESVEDGYRIYLPAESNRDNARRALALLQARGFDSYIIPKGELENGISLGVFKKRASADSRIAELRVFDYKPLMQIIIRSNQERWVILNRGERQKISDSSWSSLISGVYSLQEKENLCLDVASH